MTEDHTFELVSAEERLVPDEAELAVDGGWRPRPHRLVAAGALAVVLGTACVLAAGRGVARFRATATVASVGLAEEEGKPTLNVMVMGHLSCGKSSLVGNLLAKEGVIPSDEVDKAKAEAKDNEMASFGFAYLCDKEEEERQSGMTLHTNLLPPMETEKYKVSFIDVPGARHLVTEVKEAAAMADVALLVIGASTGEYESGIAKLDRKGHTQAGQAREHLLLAYSFGVRRLIVAVNKMDSTDPPYSAHRYEEIKKEVDDLAKKIGFNSREIAWIPVSGTKGDNLNAKSDNMGWYKGWKIINRRKKGKGEDEIEVQGKTLKEAIDAGRPVARDTEGALRMPINDGKAGEPLVAYVERGSVSVGSKVQLCPSGTPATVDKLQVGGESAESASAGDVVLATLTADAGAVVKRGGVFDAGVTWTSGAVAYGESHDCTKVDSFDATLFVMELPEPSPCRTVDFTNNFTTTIDVGFQHVPCTWKMVKKVDTLSGKLLEENPKHAGKRESVIVRLYPQVDIDLDDLDKRTSGIRVVSTDKVGTSSDTFAEITSATGVIKAINTEGDDGPPKGKNSPENKDIPYNPCFRVPECVDFFFRECPDGCDSGMMVKHDDEGNELDDYDDWGECNFLETDGAYPGEGVPINNDCCQSR